VSGGFLGVLAGAILGGVDLGLTPTHYQSGEVDRRGGITKGGDVLARTMLFEAAHALLTRARTPSALQTWGRQLAARVGLKKAVVALARKLAVVLFRLWRDGTVFVAHPTPA
jgi:transposase